MNFSFDKEFLENRVYGLDIIRFWAIMLVLISHSVILFKPFIKYTEYFGILGYFGVELFFVLSGFLIGTIIIKTFNTEDSFNRKNLKRFWIRRWFRTLPNYYLILTVYILISYLSGNNLFSNIKFLAYFIFGQNIISYHPPFFAVAWSLCVEEWFYLSFPFILFVIHSIFKNKISIKNKLIIAILVVFLGAVIIKCFVAFFLNLDWDYGFRKLVPLRLDAIMIGVIFAYANYYFTYHIAKLKKIFVLIGSIIIIHSIIVYFIDIMPLGNKNVSFYSKTFYFTLTSLGFGLFLPFANTLKIKPNKLIPKFITIVSITSYSLYLTHSLVYQLINSLFNNYNIIISIANFVLFFALSLLLSIFLYKIYEKPFTKLRDRFS